MENAYVVGIANRYALFLEEGENDITVIKKKLTKELRAKNKQEKKENAEAKKSEPVKTADKPKKPDPVPSETTPSKKEDKENKAENRGKERKPKDPETNKRDKEFQEKPRNVKNGPSTTPETDSWDKDVKMNDSAPARKNFDNRKPRGDRERERRYDNNDQYQSKGYYNQKKFNKKDETENNESGNGDTTVDDSWGTKENGSEPQQNDHKPRGGGRFRGNNRGGRNNYGGGDRGDRGDRRRGHNEQRHEAKEDIDNNKGDSWNETPVENSVENTDNQNDETKPESDTSANEQKEEVKEMLTLDEWKKMRGEREKPQYNLRKAGEGADLSQWKNMRELQKEKEAEFLENGYNGHHGSKKPENEKETSGNENVQRVARQKHIDINIHFRELTVRGGRGGRMARNNRFGFRGGRNNEERNEGYNGGEPRSNRKFREGPPGGRGGQRQHAPKIGDERDFPTLG